MNDVLHCDSFDVTVRLSDDSERFVAAGILKSDALQSCFRNVRAKLKSEFTKLIFRFVTCNESMPESFSL